MRDRILFIYNCISYGFIYYKNKIDRILSIENTRYFNIFSIAISFTFVFPLLYANHYFNDDLTRAYSGYVGWDHLGRPLAAYVSEIFTFHHYVIDISPLPLLLSIFVLSTSINIITNNIVSKASLSTTVIASLAIISPCTLQNLGYRYDCLGMALAIIFAIYSWKYTHNTTKFSLLTSAIFLTASLSFYQPSSFIVFQLILISICLNFINNRDVFKYILKSSISTASGLLIYFLFIHIKLIKTNSRSDLIFSSPDWIELFTQTAHSYINLYKEIFPKTIIILIVIATIAAIIQLIYTGAHRFISTGRNWKTILETIICSLSIPILFLLTFTPMSILKEGLCDARTAASFAFFIMGVFFILSQSKQLFIKYTAVASSLTIIIITIITSFAVGAGMSNQKLYDRSVMTSVIASLESNKVFYDRKTTIYGQTKNAKPTALIAQAFPLTNRMIHRIYDYSGYAYLKIYGIDPYFNRSTGHEIANRICENKLQPIIKNNNYSIFIINDLNFVWLGDKNCN